MPVTYTATDSTGTVHTRTSRRHIQPIYTHAVIRKPGSTRKADVSFSSSVQGAMALRGTVGAAAEVVHVDALTRP